MDLVHKWLGFKVWVVIKETNLVHQRFMGFSKDESVFVQYVAQCTSLIINL